MYERGVAKTDLPHRLFADNSMHKERVQRNIKNFKLRKMREVLKKRNQEILTLKRALKSKVICSVDMKLIQKYYNNVDIYKIRRKILFQKSQKCHKAARKIQRFWKRRRMFIKMMMTTKQKMKQRTEEKKDEKIELIKKYVQSAVIGNCCLALWLIHHSFFVKLLLKL